MGMRARRRAAVTIGLAGLLGGALVGMSSVDGFTATSPGHGSGSAGLATQSPSGRSTGGPTHIGSPTHTGSPTHGATSSPTRNGRSTASPTPTVAATPGSTAKGAPTSSPTSSPTGSSTHTPRAIGSATPKAGSSATPTPNGRSTATPRAGTSTNTNTNTHNRNWPSDSRSWRQWNGGWQDPNWRGEHSRDSGHEQGFFHDPDRFCDSRDCDRFHFDEFRNEDDSNDFRHDCDVLLSFHSVRALLDFLDGDSSLRDFFELHGDLYDFLVNHSDWSDDFDQNCTLVDLHL